MGTFARLAIAEEVKDELDRQLTKWGEQNHPSVINGLSPESLAYTYGIPVETLAKAHCDNAATITWAHIAVEELCEAVAASSDSERRIELIQLAAVIVSWIECLDRNGRA